jgi:hypothetical protein
MAGRFYVIPASALPKASYPVREEAEAAARDEAQRHKRRRVAVVHLQSIHMAAAAILTGKRVDVP